VSPPSRAHPNVFTNLCSQRARPLRVCAASFERSELLLGASSVPYDAADVIEVMHRLMVRMTCEEQRRPFFANNATRNTQHS
jgi:hypothetical protein